MLILFTPEEKHPLEFEVIEKAFELGLERLHIRKPTFSKQEYKAYILQIDQKYYSKIYLHQYHALVDEFGLGGKHFRKSDVSTPLDKIISASTGVHSITEALKQLTFYDTVFVSPVFASISKQGYSSKEDFNINHLPKEIRNRIIALGGIDKRKLNDLNKYGFEHYALLGAIWSLKNPLNELKSYL